MTEPTAAVFFDLDGTLVHDGAGDAVRRTAEILAQRHGLSEADLRSANAAAWRECWSLHGEGWMRGEMEDHALPREIWRRTLQRLSRNDPAILDEAVLLHVEAERGTFTLYEESIEVLDSLRADGVPLGLITNGPGAFQRAKLDDVGITERFDVVIASGDIGVTKPDVEIFRRALDGLGVRSAQALHVGDDFDADVVGAARAGMQALWINRDGATEPGHVRHHEGRSLRAVLTVMTQGSSPRPR